MDNVIKISKRNTGSDDSVVCWKISGENLTPNTELVVKDDGLTLLVTVNGETRVMTGGKKTIHAIFNVGKTKKAIGGNKPYDDCEILVIDQSSTFKSEWGFGQDSPVPCLDDATGAHCGAIITGHFFYKIENFFAFRSAIPGVSELTCAGLRDILREHVSGVIKAGLAKEFAARSFDDCNSNRVSYYKAITKSVNAALETMGIVIYNFDIETMRSVLLKHNDRRDAITDAIVEKKITEVQNASMRDDISVAERYVKDVEIPVIRAKNGSEKHSDEEKKTFNCPKCGEKLAEGVNYCHRCGEKFLK